MIRFVIAVLAIFVFFTWDANHSYGLACEDRPRKDKFLEAIQRSIESPGDMTRNEQMHSNVAALVGTPNLFRGRRKTYPITVPSNDRNPEPASISNDKTISNDRHFSQDKQKTYPWKMPSNEQKVPVKPGAVSNDRMAPSTPSTPTEHQDVSSEDVKADSASRAKTTGATPSTPTEHQDVSSEDVEADSASRAKTTGANTQRQPSPTGEAPISEDDLEPRWFDRFLLIAGGSALFGVLFSCIFCRWDRKIWQMFNQQTNIVQRRTTEDRRDPDVSIPLTCFTGENTESH